jgi:hypothetical protein
MESPQGTTPIHSSKRSILNAFSHFAGQTVEQPIGLSVPGLLLAGATLRDEFSPVHAVGMHQMHRAFAFHVSACVL